MIRGSSSLKPGLESGWGKSAPGNNLFGIKSHGLPGGNTLPTTEVVGGQPVAAQDSFRAYASPADSVAGYADFILNNKRYAPVRAAQGLEAQAAALGQSGYATDPAYGQKVLQIAQGLPQSAVPQVADASQPSPLDTAQYPAGPVGGPSDSAALPANATPTALTSTSNMPVIAPQAEFKHARRLSAGVFQYAGCGAGVSCRPPRYQSRRAAGDDEPIRL